MPKGASSAAKRCLVSGPFSAAVCPWPPLDAGQRGDDIGGLEPIAFRLREEGANVAEQEHGVRLRGVRDARRNSWRVGKEFHSGWNAE